MTGLRKDLLEQLSELDVNTLVNIQAQIAAIITEKIKDKKPQEVILRLK